jgi:hypothetical protein
VSPHLSFQKHRALWFHRTANDFVNLNHYLTGQVKPIVLQLHDTSFGKARRIYRGPSQFSVPSREGLPNNAEPHPERGCEPEANSKFTQLTEHPLARRRPPQSAWNSISSRNEKRAKGAALTDKDVTEIERRKRSQHPPSQGGMKLCQELCLSQVIFRLFLSILFHRQANISLSTPTHIE